MRGTPSMASNPDPPRPSSVATVSTTRRQRPSSARVSGDRRATKSEKESSAMSSTVVAATAMFDTGKLPGETEKGDGGEVLRSVSHTLTPMGHDLLGCVNLWQFLGDLETQIPFIPVFPSTSNFRKCYFNKILVICPCFTISNKIFSKILMHNDYIETKNTYIIINFNILKIIC